MKIRRVGNPFIAKVKVDHSTRHRRFIYLRKGYGRLFRQNDYVLVQKIEVPKEEQEVTQQNQEDTHLQGGDDLNS